MCSAFVPTLCRFAYLSPQAQECTLPPPSLPVKSASPCCALLPRAPLRPCIPVVTASYSRRRPSTAVTSTHVTTRSNPHNRFDALRHKPGFYYTQTRHANPLRLVSLFNLLSLLARLPDPRTPYSTRPSASRLAKHKWILYHPPPLPVKSKPGQWYLCTRLVLTVCCCCVRRTGRCTTHATGQSLPLNQGQVDARTLGTSRRSIWWDRLAAYGASSAWRWRYGYDAVTGSPIHKVTGNCTVCTTLLLASSRMQGNGGRSARHPPALTGRRSSSAWWAEHPALRLRSARLRRCLRPT